MMEVDFFVGRRLKTRVGVGKDEGVGQGLVSRIGILKIEKAKTDFKGSRA